MPDPMPSEEQTPTVPDAASYIFSRDRGDAERLRALARFFTTLFQPRWERAGVRTADSILDVGCGIGRNTARLAALAPTRAQIVGIDIFAPFLKQGQREAALHGRPDIDF